MKVETITLDTHERLVTRGISLSEMIREYFELSQPAFASRNQHVIDLTSAFLPLLASRAWINRGTLIPATFFIALTGYPRSGKTAFLKNLRRVLPSSISRIPIGSPEFIVQEIGARRHGILIYDEISQLEKLLSRYMDTFMPILNSMYYLYDLDLGRRDEKKSVFVPAEDYFVDVIFSGTPEDWESIILKAVGGFVRRILRVHVHGRIPLFEEDEIDMELERKRALLQSKIRAVLDALTHVNLIVVLRGLKHYAELVESRVRDPEKQSMIEEYAYKYLAGKLLSYLITVEEDVSADEIDTDYILSALERNITNLRNVDITIYNSNADIIDVDITYFVVRDQTLDRFLPPNFADAVLNTLISIVTDEMSAPSDVVLKNAQKIRQFVDETHEIVVTYRTFVRDILKLRSAYEYKQLVELLEDAGYIRIYDNPRGRGKLVVLDTRVPICANCAFFMNAERCPRLDGILDPRLVEISVDSRACSSFVLTEDYEREVMKNEE
ncbi:MAG: hypothetical protein H0Z24_09115 [Thermosipho sp. (in: Bacteria)]|nr:hypothetical protein [Thermosipho sp. (in: thermotogales)]